MKMSRSARRHLLRVLGARAFLEKYPAAFTPPPERARYWPWAFEMQTKHEHRFDAAAGARRLS